MKNIYLICLFVSLVGCGKNDILNDSLKCQSNDTNKISESDWRYTIITWKEDKPKRVMCSIGKTQGNSSLEGDIVDRCTVSVNEFEYYVFGLWEQNDGSFERNIKHYVDGQEDVSSRIIIPDPDYEATPAVGCEKSVY